MFPKPENAVEYRDLLRSTVDAPDIILELPVRYELKKEKFEPRLLVLTQYRLYILTCSNRPGKVESSYNILDIANVESSSRTSLKLSLLPDSKCFSFLSASTAPVDGSQAPTTNDMDSFLAAFVYAYRLTFPESSRRPLPAISTNPAARIEAIISGFGCVSSPNAAATFSAAYRCSCDRLNAEYKPFVAWDVDTIFWMHEDRELELNEFEQGPVDTLTSKDYLPLFAALQYDTWFTSLNLNQVKLTPEIVQELCNVLATNRTLTDLRMSNVTGKSMQEILTKVQGTLERCHGISSVSLLDLSGNSFDDKAIAALCSILGCLSSRLSHLSLGRCQLAKNQICQLADAPGLRAAAMSGSLNFLDLSSSTCKSDDTSAALCNLISNATALRHLNLSCTDINLQHLGNALSVGPAGTLVALDVSQNSNAFRQHSDKNSSSSQFVKFLLSASALKRLNFAENKLNSDLLRHLLNAIAGNSLLTDVDIDFSSNELQKTSGAVAILVEMLPLCSCFGTINFSDNGLDADFSKLVESSSRCPSLVKLNFSKNMPSTKYRLPVAETFANILQAADTRLRMLDVSDCRLRQATSTLCAALTDARLAEIDISGNQMADSGVVYLAKALQGNTRLKRLNIDRNQITLAGFQVLVTALQKNYTLTSLPTPLADVGQIMTAKASMADRCSQIFAKMEILLSRNRENVALGSTANNTVAKQVFRFQTGCGISENLEALWQMYGEVEHLFMSIQPPGSENLDETCLLEAAETLSVVREILRKLSNMTYPMPNISSSERFFSEALEQVASKSFQPVIDHLVQAVEILAAHPRHHLLPMSISSVRQILDQTAQGCNAECHRETSRALASACQLCHYASLFRVLESITVAVRDRLRECKHALTERATKGRPASTHKPVLMSSISTPGNGAFFPVSKYGTLNRRQRPVSAMTPDMMPGGTDEASEEASHGNHIYTHVAPVNPLGSVLKGAFPKRTLAADVFSTPLAHAQDTVMPHHQTEIVSSSPPGALLTNPCKERPKKPKNQRPTRPVVVAGGGEESDPAPAAFVLGAEPSIEVSPVKNGSHSSNGHSRLRAHEKSPSPPAAASVTTSNGHSSNSALGISASSHSSSARERNESNSADELLKDSPQHQAAKSNSLNKAVIGGVKVGPIVNLQDFKLKKTGITTQTDGIGTTEQTPPPKETATANLLAGSAPNSAEHHNVQPSAILKRLSSLPDEASNVSNDGNTGSTISVLRPKPPVKPAKPPKPAVSIPVVAAPSNMSKPATGTSAGGADSPSVERPPSPPGFADSSTEAFADRMSRFGGAVKARRDQVRSMIDVPAANSNGRPPRPGENGSDVAAS